MYVVINYIVRPFFSLLKFFRLPEKAVVELFEKNDTKVYLVSLPVNTIRGMVCHENTVKKDSRVIKGRRRRRRRKRVS